MVADAPTGRAPLIAALFMLPTLEGIDPLFRPMQYKVSPVRSPAVVPALIKLTVTVIDVLETLDAERDDTKGRVDNIVGAAVGANVGDAVGTNVGAEEWNM